MLKCSVLIASAASLLALNACVTTGKVTTEDTALFGECKYSTQVRDGKAFAVNYFCYGKKTKDKNGKEYTPHVSLHCTSNEFWSIVLNAGYEKQESSIASVELTFDNNPTIKEKWGRFIVWSPAYQKEKFPNTIFFNHMKSSDKLTYSYDGKSISLNLTGAADGVRKYEETCKRLKKAST